MGHDWEACAGETRLQAAEPAPHLPQGDRGQPSARVSLPVPGTERGTQSFALSPQEHTGEQVLRG